MVKELFRPFRKHRCPRCNADLECQEVWGSTFLEKRWICQNPICGEIWFYRINIKNAS